GLVGFLSTHLIFSLKERGRSVAILETIALAGVYYKLLSFARASEDTFQASAEWTIALLAAGAAAFLIHALVLYLSAFPDRGTTRRRKELAVFAIVGLPLLLITAILLPPNFVKNRIALNDLNEEPPEKPKELEDPAGGNKGGGGKDKEEQSRRNGLPLGDREERYPSELQKQGGGAKDSDDVQSRERRPDEQRGGSKSGRDKNQENRSGSGSEMSMDQGRGGKSRSPKNKLKQMRSKDWNKNQSSGGGESGNQMAVMVVASPVDPVYAAEGYWGNLDPVKGFIATPPEKERLNALTKMRLIEKWQDPVPGFDQGRSPFEVFYMSTLTERTAAYRPYTITPTVMDKRYHPFDLSYSTVSRMSLSGPDEWRKIPGLSPQEKSDYADYLAVNLSPQDAAVWRGRANNIIAGKRGYFERVEALLKSLHRYKYEMGFDEDTSVKKMTHFLQFEATGDCTEFSHSTALLARIAGVPSRVVVGYLASRDLQTPAHRRGVQALRSRIPPLQKYRPQDLYLVTTSHHHAWVQLYMPGYGWVDIETTSYAIPPEPKMDPNSMDVVIPLIEEMQEPGDLTFKFPYRLVGKVLGGAVLIVLVFLYIYRYSREAWYALRARGESRAAVQSAMTLLLMRLAVDGHPLKAPYETPKEFSGRFPNLRMFAGLYTSLNFQENFAPGEKAEALAAYRTAAHDVIQSTRKRGFWRAVRRA
ncbi:MAG: transglutaminase domain-containing protein, partial [Spirochaetia bacterium]|nr:transglutaminase domain-containing protein [Spirochaetia bacterium]